jgi:hypothetical protein
MHFRAEDVRKWHERAEEHLRHDMCDPHLFYIARILHTHAIHYLNKVSRETSLSYGLERKNYFRKMTRKYRFYFM